ncbi:MAG: hypothetical protein WA004_15230 [Saprospiraceae bacterium]
MKHFNVLLAIMLINLSLITEYSVAQALQYDSKTEVVMSDGMNVTLFKSPDSENWYYLPPSESIHLGEKPDGTPEFLFVKFTTEQRAEQGGVQGALLHALFEWGFTPEEEKDLATKLAQKTKGKGILAGPVDLQAAQGESFRIVSAVLQDKQMTSTLITSGMAPPMPGGKAAVAARMDKNAAQLLDATFRKSRSITDISMVLDYEYTLLVKAARGTLEYKLDITHQQGDGMAYDLIKKELDKQPKLYDQAIAYYEKNKNKLTDQCGTGDGMVNVLIGLQAIDNVAGNTTGAGDTGSPWEYGVSENMVRKMYDYFESKELIVLNWEETLDDTRLQVIREAFFNFFLNAFTEPAFPELSTMSNLQTGVKLGDEAIKKAAQGGYKFKSCTQMNSNRLLRKTIRLDNITLPIRRRFQMVTNLASTYDQVKNNPKCVTQVNLNDPFFEHRDINFIVDVEAMDIFKEEINYVTINVMKKRSSGNSFEASATLSPEVIRQKGRLATITYAREGDKSADVYDYKVQWSLRGGQRYPENPLWQKGDWEAVTLTCPVKPRTIEFEADLDEMREQGITRATLQLRYMKYGKETESNIPLTVSKNEPLVSQRIYTDADVPGYAYRLIINHKEKGKLAFDWDSKINDDYVYAVIPDKLKDNDQSFIERAKKAAELIVQPGPNGEVPKQELILNRFKDLLEILIED